MKIDTKYSIGDSAFCVKRIVTDDSAMCPACRGAGGVSRILLDGDWCDTVCTVCRGAGRINKTSVLYQIKDIQVESVSTRTNADGTSVVYQYIGEDYPEQSVFSTREQAEEYIYAQDAQ